MERHVWGAVLVLCLGLPVPALASGGPEVPAGALSAVPEAVRDDWREREERVAELTRELESARSALDRMGSLEAARAARRDLRAALDDARNLQSAARADLQAATLARAEARIALDTARLEVRLARDALREARGGRGRAAVKQARARRGEARDHRDAARDELAAATEHALRTEHSAEDQLAVAEKAIATATRALNEVGAISGAVRPRKITERELDLLEARRDLAVAELERDRALAVVAAGVRLRLRPFVDALERARVAEVGARQALQDDAGVAEAE